MTDKEIILNLEHVLETAKKELEAWRDGTNTRNSLKDFNAAKVGSCFGGLPSVNSALNFLQTKQD